MLDVTVIENAAAAEASLDPIRTRLLAELASRPGSATTLATKVGLPRQKVNYHLRTLERHGLDRAGRGAAPGQHDRARPARDRRRLRHLAGGAGGGRAGPGPLAGSAVGVLDAGPRAASWSATSARCSCGADQGAASGWRPSPWTARSGSPRRPIAPPSPRSSPRASAGLVAKYHDEAAPDGRRHRIVLAIHPSVPDKEH